MILLPVRKYNKNMNKMRVISSLFLLFFVTYYVKSISVIKGALGTRNTHVKLGDGCYHIFLDVGANVGVHGRFLFEPHQYPKMKRHTINIYAKHFGDADTRDPRDVCVFAFEPNPAHKKRHLDLKEAYGKVGLRYHPIFAGVSDLDGNLTFYHQDSGQNNEWGFSTVKRNDSNESSVDVPVIRLSTWLKYHIHDRIIPDKPHVTIATPSSKVVMKIDIEGMEHILLPDLILNGKLCEIVDYIFGEYHGWGGDAKPNPETGLGGLMVKDPSIYAQSLVDAINSLRNEDCKLKQFDLFDDESYLLDGIPLPPPHKWWKGAYKILFRG